MRMIDHYILGTQIAAMMPEMKKTEKRSFLLGCIWPDINPLSRIGKMSRYQMLYGHGYVDPIRFIERYINRLSKKAFNMYWEPYTFGKLIHYIAEAFTYSNNSEFDGGAKAQAAYEQQLHETLCNGMPIQGPVEEGLTKFNGKELFHWLEEEHDRYLTSRKGADMDKIYICRITYCILENLTRVVPEKRYRA